MAVASDPLTSNIALEKAQLEVAVARENLEKAIVERIKSSLSGATSVDTKKISVTGEPTQRSTLREVPSTQN